MILKALQEGNTEKAANHLIDLLGLGESRDVALHFLNEAIAHKDPRGFAANFIQYVLVPKIRRGRRRKR